MTNLYNLVFVLQLITFVTIMFTSLYNILRVGNGFDIKICLILFVGIILTYSSGFVTVMLDHSEMLFVQLFKLETWLLLLNVLFFIVELILFLTNAAQTQIESYKSIEAYKGKGV